MKFITTIIALFSLILKSTTTFDIPKQNIKNFRVCDYSFSLIKSNKKSKNFIPVSTGEDFGKSKNSSVQYLSLEIFFVSRKAIQFIFRDKNETRFEMPLDEPFPFHNYDNRTIYPFDMEYDFEFKTNENSFNFAILRKSSREVIFSTVDMNIILQNNYAEISTSIPSENLYGLGQRTTSFKIKSGTYTMYNQDAYGKIEDGKGTGKHRYGSHPMYLMREKSGNYHINYLRNSLPMDVIVNHDQSMLTYKIAGGVLDFTIFLGDTNPENVIKSYHKFLGGYAMPPFWSFGFHQSRYGYKSLSMVEEVLNKYKSLNLPLDVIWNDIDYMLDYMSFTVDTERFNLDALKAMLNKFKKKYVMIGEPTIGTKWNNFEYLKKGLELDIFIKNDKGENLLNKVWSGKSHFIDYFNPNSKIFWNDAMTALHKKLIYDGVWLDMNEIATFEAGQINTNDQKISCDDNNKYDYIPGKQPFETRTLCPNAIHHSGLRHIQVHNYYANMQAKLTYEFLEHLHPDQFPFVLTRANAPGIGKYSAVWSGDNFSTFSFYQYSIAEVFNFNLFGAPMAGADICGFAEKTQEILCSKWYQMGSLYPFSRSHSEISSNRKEPFAMGDTLSQTTLKSLQFRYSILKYYYSLFMMNNGTGTIFRPLFFEFWDDPKLLEYNNIQNFFMIGSSLLGVPNFNENDNGYITAAYFPRGDWYDLRNNTRVNKKSNDPETIQIKQPLNEMPSVFLRAGNIIFTNYYENVSSTEDLNNKFRLLIAFDSFNKNNFAVGVMPALINYHSRKSVENCMRKDCYVTINSAFDCITKIINLSFSKANFYENDYTYIEIPEIIVFGLNINEAICKIAQSSDKFLNPEKYKDYEITIINDYSFSITFKSPIELSTEKIFLTIQLDNNLFI